MIATEFGHRFVPDVRGHDGCDTCGYGAKDGMSCEEFDKLLAEIDAWVRQNFTPITPAAASDA